MSDPVTWKEPMPASEEPAKPKSNLELVAECDSFPYYQTDPELYLRHLSTYYHLKLPSRTSTFGYLLPSVAEVLRGLPDWELDDEQRTLTLTAGEDAAGGNADAASRKHAERERSAAVERTTQAMRKTGHFKILDGWRNEIYPVYDIGGEKVFEIERAASALFGVVTYGCHLTAYVREPTAAGDELRVWVPMRAKSKSTYPGMLDNTVAGGIADGETAFECLVREAAEEASFPEDVIRAKTKSAGVVTYFHIRDERAGGESHLLQPECQYVFDLEMDESVKPQPNDGEVEWFELMSVDQIKQWLAKGVFKPNCALVMLDFLIRHGILTERNEKDYVEIVARLHRRLEFPTV